MSRCAAEVVEEWVRTGATRVIIHVEMRGDLDLAISKIKDQVEIGLAINVETPIDVLEKYIEQIDFVQCMGIDNIGFQGQSFDQKVIDKIKLLRSKYPELIISVDGGVSLESASILIEAGADRLVAGSAIFNAENSFDAVEAFKRL
jgi:ribulose-phosphate 3-epimerase